MGRKNARVMGNSHVRISKDNFLGLINRGGNILMHRTIVLDKVRCMYIYKTKERVKDRLGISRTFHCVVGRRTDPNGSAIYRAGFCYRSSANNIDVYTVKRIREN